MVLLPESHEYYLTSFHKECKRNSQRLRDCIENLIKEREKAMLKPDYIDKGDLVSILLDDENFKNDRSRIIDEAMTFFLAGS